MRLEVPYFKQDNDYTCGPAVLHMLSAFYGLGFTSRRIQQMVNADPEHGTTNADLVAAAGELGLKAVDKDGASIDEIRKFLAGGHPVVVNFIEPASEEGHYSLVIGIEDEKIIFNDPLSGPGYAMPIGEFDRRWRSGFEDRARWLMVAMPK